MAQDTLLAGCSGKGLSGASLTGAALQLLPLTLTRASILYPRMTHVHEPGAQYIAVDFAGMGLGPLTDSTLERMLPETLTTASALHPTTRHNYQAGRLVRLACRVSAVAMSAFAS